MLDDKELQPIKQLLDSAENNIRQARAILFSNEVRNKVKSLDLTASENIIEGVFDGENMIGPDGHVYKVAPNYASKSKLLPGDILKLSIQEDGSFVFKQIGPIKRKKVVGTLEEIASGKFIVNVEGTKYRILTASVTYFKSQHGDKLVCLVPEKGESEWAAVENILEKTDRNEEYDSE